MLCIALLLLVTARSLQSASTANKCWPKQEPRYLPFGWNVLHGTKESYPSMADAPFKFPDEVESMRGSHPKPAMLSLYNKFGDSDVHESCKDLTYCTKRPADYPEDKFTEMLKDYKIPPMPTFDALGNRQGDIDYNDGCNSEVTYEPLYKVRGKSNEAWRTVIQAPKRNYVQAVRLETCSSTGKQCFEPFLPLSGYVTSCEQTYNQWEVLVEKLDGSGTELVKANLPVCCSCKYRHVGFVTRINIDSDESSSKTNKFKPKSH